MNDLALFTLIKSILDTSLAANDLDDVIVTQDYQAEQQGRMTARTLYLHKIADNRYGYPLKEDLFDDEDFIHRETNNQETTFQVSAYVPVNPASTTELTAGDLAAIAAQIMQSDVALAALKAQNVGIYRITQVRQIFIRNEYDRNEASPSFDFVLTHKRVFETRTPKVSSYEIGIHHV